MTAIQTHSAKMQGQRRPRGLLIKYGIARLALLAISLSSVSVNAGDRWTPGVWPSDYRADDTNATAIIQTNLYALQRTEIYSLTAASSNGVSTNIPRFELGGELVGGFDYSPYSWTNVYYYRINDIGVTNYTPTSSNNVMVYTSGVYVVSNAASYSTTSGVYSFRANHIDLRTLDVQHNYNRRYEIYAPTQTAYIADNWPFTLSTNFHFNEYSQATNLNLYKSERANLVYIKSQLKDTFSKYLDMSKADTNGDYQAYLKSATNWTWTHVSAYPPTSTNDASYYMWIQRRPQDMPVISIESLVKADSNFPHTITTNIFTNDAPGWVYDELYDETISQPYTTLTYSSSWFDWTPYRAIGGYSSNDVYGHVVSNQWTFDPWGMSTTNATTNYLWTASSNSTDWRVIYSANYDTNGSKTQACASVEFLTVPQYSNCVATPTNYLTYGVLVTNSWIDEGFTVSDYGWRWVPFVFSNMAHYATEPSWWVTNYYEVKAVFNDCGLTNICTEDWSGAVYQTNFVNDYYFQYVSDFFQPETQCLLCVLGYVDDQSGNVDGRIYQSKAQGIHSLAPIISESQASLYCDYYIISEMFRSDFRLLSQTGPASYGPIVSTNLFGFELFFFNTQFANSIEVFKSDSVSIDPGQYDWTVSLTVPTNITSHAWDYQFSSIEWILTDGTGYTNIADQVKGYYIINIKPNAIYGVVKFD